MRGSSFSTLVVQTGASQLIYFVTHSSSVHAVFLHTSKAFDRDYTWNYSRN